MQVNTIAEQIFFTTVRIDIVATTSSQGSATSFFLAYNIGAQDYLCIVTNKHVAG